MTEDKRKSERLIDLFSAFHICFHFLSQAFLRIPEEEFVGDIIHANLFSEWPVEGTKTALTQGLRMLQDFSARWQPVQIEALKSDHTRLFFGLEKTLAPPYASVYLSEEHLLFDKQTLEARQFYKQFDLKTDTQHREPDDHIGNEFFFLSFLCQKAAQAAQSRDDAAWRVYQKALKEFLSAHLLLWLDPFLSRIKKNAETLYIQGLAHLAQGMVEILSEYLGIPPENNSSSNQS